MKRLIAIQNELKCNKSQYNSFGKYSYRSCEDILEAVKPLLAKHGCALMLRDSIENIGNRFYVKAEALLYAEDGTLIGMANAYAREDETKKGMDGAQVTGASSSYARKYALNGLFCIDDTKDADATNRHEKDDSAPSEDNKSVLSDYQKKVILSYPPETQAWACNYYGLLSIDEMSAEQATEIINAVKKKKEGA